MRRVLATVTIVALAALWGVAAADASTNRAVAWQVARTVFGSHASTAFCISRWESTFSPTAVSRTNDHGLFQIHDGLRMYGRAIYNPWFNARVAYRMSNHGTDWSPWTSHWRCGV